MNFLKKVAQELSPEFSEQQKEVLKKFLTKLVGSDKPFDSRAIGKSGLLGWILSSNRDGGSVVKGTKMELIPQLKGHPVFDQFVKDLFKAAIMASKCLYSGASRDEAFSIAEDLSGAMDKLERIIENKKFLKDIISNSETHNKEIIGSGWLADSYVARITNHLKEFKATFNNEFFAPVMSLLFDQEVQKEVFEKEEKEKYLNEVLLIWMMKHYPKILGLSSTRDILYDQLDIVSEFDRKTGSNIIGEIGNFLQKAQLAGLGSENGPDDEIVEKLNEKRELIYSDLTQIPELNDPDYPNLKLTESREINRGRNSYLQRQDKVNSLDAEQSRINSLTQEDKDKVTEINLKIEEVKKKSNQIIGKLERSVKAKAAYGLDSADYKEAKSKLKKAQELLKAQIEALEKEKQDILMSRKASKIAKELGLV